MESRVVSQTVVGDRAIEDETDAHVLGKVAAALEGYRPSYQAKMMQRYIEELPPEVDDDTGEAALEHPFVKQVAQWFRSLRKTEKLAAYMLQTCLTADNSSSGIVPTGLYELGNVIIREYQDEFEISACDLFEQITEHTEDGQAAIAFVLNQME